MKLTTTYSEFLKMSVKIDEIRSQGDSITKEEYIKQMSALDMSFANYIGYQGFTTSKYQPDNALYARCPCNPLWQGRVLSFSLTKDVPREAYYFWFQGPLMMVRVFNHLAKQENTDDARDILKYFKSTGQYGYDGQHGFCAEMVQYDRIKQGECLMHNLESADSWLFYLANHYSNDPRYRDSGPHPVPITYDEWFKRETLNAQDSRFLTHPVTGAVVPMSVSLQRDIRRKFHEWMVTLKKWKSHLDDPMFIKFLEWTSYEPCLWLPLVKDI